RASGGRPEGQGQGGQARRRPEPCGDAEVQDPGDADDHDLQGWREDCRAHRRADAETTTTGLDQRLDLSKPRAWQAQAPFVWLTPPSFPWRALGWPGAGSRLARGWPGAGPGLG